MMWAPGWLKKFRDPVTDRPGKKIFRFGKKSISFGVKLDALNQENIALAEAESDGRYATLYEDGAILGQRFASIEVMCFGINRPIEQLWYKFPLQKKIGHLKTIVRIHESLVRVLGRPATASGRLNDICMTSPNDVMFHANWRYRHCLWGVSWFGGVRTEHGQQISGLLYHQWDDEKAAAEPFVPEFRQQQNWLDNIAIPVVVARLPDGALCGPHVRKWIHLGAPTAPELDHMLIEAQRALYTPTLMFTPQHWLVSLSIRREGEFVVWISDKGLIGVSTLHDTWISLRGVAPKVSEYLTHPAKGAGSHTLRVGEIEVEAAYMPDGNPAIKNMLIAIRAAASINYQFHESSNC